LESHQIGHARDAGRIATGEALPQIMALVNNWTPGGLRGDNGAGLGSVSTWAIIAGLV
jgi:hypothetical protein